MLPDRVSNPGPLTYESGALLIALHGPAKSIAETHYFSRQSQHLKFLVQPSPFDHLIEMAVKFQR